MKDYKKKIISAFAFKTGNLIENLIIEQTNNLEQRNQELEGKILHWYITHKDDKEFSEYFGIKEVRDGRE